MKETLLDAIEMLPEDPERGFRFLDQEGRDRFHSWASLRQEGAKRAARFRDLGLRQGDRVALAIADPESFVLTFVAIVMAGLVAVPMNSRVSFGFKTNRGYVETTGQIVRASGSRIIIADRETKAALADVGEFAPELERTLTVDEIANGDASTYERPNVSPSDSCFLQFTSGSTSAPKAVIVTHANVVENTSAIYGPSGMDRRGDDICAVWLPLYHDMGLIGFVLGPLVMEIPSILLATEAFIRRPSMWIGALAKYKATITFATPFGYAMAARRTRDEDLVGVDLSRVRIAGCGAEPIRADWLRAFSERFASVGFQSNALMPAYGMAEATLAIAFHPHGTPFVSDWIDGRSLTQGSAEPCAPNAEGVELVSNGVPFAKHGLRIVDADGRALPERGVGEVWVCGPSVTAGYFGRPDATEETFHDGWLRTGDLGYLADGNLYLCGRIKDLIILNGANYYPQDIEWAVGDVDGVRAHAVVAFSTLRGAEETLVVCAEGKSPEPAQLRRAIATRVAEMTGLHVGHVLVLEAGALPMTTSGKVQRRKTKQLFEAGTLRELA